MTRYCPLCRKEYAADQSRCPLCGGKLKCKLTEEEQKAIQKQNDETIIIQMLLM